MVGIDGIPPDRVVFTSFVLLGRSSAQCECRQAARQRQQAPDRVWRRLVGVLIAIDFPGFGRPCRVLRGWLHRSFSLLTSETLSTLPHARRQAGCRDGDGRCAISAHGDRRWRYRITQPLSSSASDVVLPPVVAERATPSVIAALSAAAPWLMAVSTYSPGLGSVMVCVAEKL